MIDFLRDINQFSCSSFAKENERLVNLSKKENCTVAVYSWFIANNFVIGFYYRCLEILCQIAFSSIANYFRFYRKKQFGIESVGIYSRNL